MVIGMSMFTFCLGSVAYRSVIVLFVIVHCFHWCDALCMCGLGSLVGVVSAECSPPIGQCIPAIYHTKTGWMLAHFLKSVFGKFESPTNWIDLSHSLAVNYCAEVAPKELDGTKNEAGDGSILAHEMRFARFYCHDRFAALLILILSLFAFWVRSHSRSFDALHLSFVLSNGMLLLWALYLWFME